jgi:hypothetical protein
MAQPLELRIQFPTWREKLWPEDAIEVWSGDQLVTTLPGAWMYEAVGQALGLAHLALPLLTALSAPRIPPQRAARRGRPPGAQGHAR